MCIFVDDVIIVDPGSAERSPRKSSRAAPAKSYKEVDPSLYEERKPKSAKNRSLEKFKEFFKAATERSKHASVDFAAKAPREARPPKEPKQPREPKQRRPRQPKVPRASMNQFNGFMDLQQNGIAALGNLLPPSIASALSISLVPPTPNSAPPPMHNAMPLPLSHAANNPFLQSNHPFASIFAAHASTPIVPNVPGSMALADGSQLGHAGFTPKRRGRKPVILTEEEREARKQAYKRKLAEKLKEKRRLEREAKEQAKVNIHSHLHHVTYRRYMII